MLFSKELIRRYFEKYGEVCAPPVLYRHPDMDRFQRGHVIMSSLGDASNAITGLGDLLADVIVSVVCGSVE